MSDQKREFMTMERFTAMLKERGLTARLYSEPRHSRTCGDYTSNLVDVKRGDNLIETYQASIIPYFNEKYMEREIDKLAHPDYDRTIHGIRKEEDLEND